VASRIVNKQRAQFGETRAEKEKAKKGQSPDANLPIGNYQHLTVPEVKKKLGGLSRPEARKVRSYEQKHKNRKGILDEIEKRLNAA
jgi:hypothetical protein